jgi:hypothetical protein
LISLPLIFHKGRDAPISDKNNIVFKSLVTHETVTKLSSSSMHIPLLAVSLLRTLPAEFNASFLYGTRDKGTPSFDTAFTFASPTPAIGRAVVGRAKSA